MTPEWLSGALGRDLGFFSSAVGHPEFTIAGDRSTNGSPAPGARAAMLLQLPPPPGGAAAWAPAPARAADAVLSGAPHRLLFSGMTFVLLGSWETPPSTLSRREACELIAAGGGRLLDIDFALVPEGATPSAAELEGARARALAGGLAEGGGQAMLDAVGEGPAPDELPPPTPSEDLAVPWGSEARAWRTTLFALCCLPSMGARAAPPLVALCDAPAAPLPPPLRALLQLPAAPHAPRAAVLTPQWLLDCAAAYTLLDPLGGRVAPHVHPPFLEFVGGAGAVRRGRA
jgi:hypothetical protein